MRAARTVAIVAVLVALAGCGSSGKTQGGLANGQRQALIAQLEAARVAAKTHDAPAARAALTAFRRSVARLERQGALSAPAARLLRVGAVRALAKLAGKPVRPAPPAPAAATTPTAATTTPATTTPPPPVPPGLAKHGHDKGKPGKGHGKGAEGD